MENFFSPFINKIFMTNLEMKLISANLMSSFWKSYVDNVCTIIKKNEVENSTIDCIPIWSSPCSHLKGRSITFLEHCYEKSTALHHDGTTTVTKAVNHPNFPNRFAGREHRLRQITF